MAVWIGIIFAFMVAVRRSSSEVSPTLPAFETITEDLVDVPTTKLGTVPTWLKGYFLRQSCGSHGEVRSMSGLNHIEHLFDCIPMHSQYKINGDSDTVTFYNRYPQTVTTDIWRHYNMNMNDSRVYFRTILSAYDVDQVYKWSGNYSNPDKVPDVGHVTWWEHQSDVLSVYEYIDVQKVDLATLDTSKYNFRDVNLGYPPGTRFIDNPAHAQKEKDDTLWSTVVAIEMDYNTGKGVAKNAVYRLQDGYRVVVGEYIWGNIDITTCNPEGGHYSDLSVRAGYMHSFAMTENYIILPTSGWLVDYCKLFVNPREEGLFKQSYQWYDNTTSRLVVMRKSDGFIVTSIDTSPFFTTHQLNAYEKDGKIYMDMLTYPNADIYLKYMYIKNLLDEVGWTTRVERFVIDMTSWKLLERKNLFDRNYALEFSNINHEQFSTKPYTYSYMNNRPFLRNGGVIKLNVETGGAVEYLLPAGVIGNEPVFVAAPDPLAEDDGVLLLQGVDVTAKKGLMIILDAATMTELSRVDAPDRALLGLHNKFFPREFSTKTHSTGIASSVRSSSLICAVLLILHSISTYLL